MVALVIVVVHTASGFHEGCARSLILGLVLSIGISAIFIEEARGNGIGLYLPLFCRFLELLFF